MELIGNGLNKGSHMYFYTASQTAKKLLYYPIAIGEFYCNKDYSVERTTNYDSILAIYILDGSITLQQEGTVLTAYRNELLLVDCYKTHKYFADANAHTVWVHFDGNNSRQWFEEIKLKKGQKIKCNRQTADCISNMIKYIKLNQNEYDISNEIYALLCSISKGNELTNENKKTDFIEKSKAFILSNYDKNISVNDIAYKALMSASFFSKVFKETTGFSPYDYLLAVRLDKAKELLQQTDDSVQNIAFKTGFNSTSNFIYFFKKQTGISPLKFRKIKF
ncbi:MAG: helix-turn-helix transcriptional regulator [Clostridiales bacterium]|nr:helix-turn-helix transcriptional regulator [Clostridiales bacterium]